MSHTEASRLSELVPFADRFPDHSGRISFASRVLDVFPGSVYERNLVADSYALLTEFRVRALGICPLGRLLRWTATKLEGIRDSRCMYCCRRSLCVITEEWRSKARES